MANFPLNSNTSYDTGTRLICMGLIGIIWNCLCSLVFRYVVNTLYSSWNPDRVTIMWRDIFGRFSAILYQKGKTLKVILFAFLLIFSSLLKKERMLSQRDAFCISIHSFSEEMQYILTALRPLQLHLFATCKTWLILWAVMWKKRLF